MSILYIDEHFACSNYTSDFYSGFAYYNVIENDFFYPIEKKYHCILFILEGKVNIFIDNQKYILKKGFSILVPSDSKFYLEAASNTSFITNYFDSPIDLCEKIALESLISTHSSTFKIPILKFKKAHRSFLLSLKSYLKDGVSCKHFHAMKEKEMFFIFRYYYTKDEILFFFRSIVSKNLDFKNIVLQNYKNVTSIKELAKKCNYSLSSFNRHFKNDFGENPYIWLQKQKLEHIKVRLKNKQISLNQIVDEFNFSSPSHLTSFCKRHLRMSPSEYRNLNL